MPSRRGDLDWLNVLDLDAALVSLHYEMQGDWYRDPWGWPEIDWVIKRKRTDLLLARLNGEGVGRAAKVDVPKENFATRPAIVIDPLDRIIYQALVDVESKKLIGHLKPWVYGWRLVPDSPKPGEWSHNEKQYAMFRHHLSAAADVSACALKADVVSFFASTNIDALCEMIAQRCGGGLIPERLTNLIRGWDSIAGRHGLAQRSVASAALANMYLGPVDDVLRSYSPVRSKLLSSFLPQGRVARWMDDIWVFGQDAGRMRGAQIEIQDALRASGLELNHAKTDVLEGPRVEEEAKKIQHSAVDGALLVDPGEPQDVGPLMELVEKLLDSPSSADRTSVKFATTRMRDHKFFDPVPEFAAKAERMPHVADSLARLFRDSGYWREMETWYVDYANSPWAKIRWSVAQFGTMFPSKEPVLDIVRDFLASVLQQRVPLPLRALAAQRLAAWAPDDARGLLREVALEADHPLDRRVLALAGVTAGEDRSVTRQILSEFEENRVTREMLVDVRYRVRVKPDFDPS